MYDINDNNTLPEGTFPIQFNTTEQYKWKDPWLMEKLKYKTYKIGSFYG